ncbi:Thrombospondin type-1 domain-containing protein 1, partial [Clarias magur]
GSSGSSAVWIPGSFVYRELWIGGIELPYGSHLFVWCLPLVLDRIVTWGIWRPWALRLTDPMH